MFDADHILPISDHVDKADQHPSGISAPRTFDLLAVPECHPGFESVLPSDDYPSDWSARLDDGELSKFHTMLAEIFSVGCVALTS